MVSLERFDHFLHDMEARRVTVVLCGVRPALAKAMAVTALWIGCRADRVFPEEAEKFSATLKAVRHVYELSEDNPKSAGFTREAAQQYFQQSLKRMPSLSIRRAPLPDFCAASCSARRKVRCWDF